MIYRPLAITCLYLSLAIQVCAQQPSPGDFCLRTGVERFENIDARTISEFRRRRHAVLGRSFHFVHFSHIPTPSERAQLHAAGVELLDYIPDNVYVTAILDPGGLSLLKKLGAEGILEVGARQKLAPGLKEMAEGQGRKGKKRMEEEGHLAEGEAKGSVEGEHREGHKRGTAESRESSKEKGQVREQQGPSLEMQVLFYACIPYDTAINLLKSAGFVPYSFEKGNPQLARLRCPAGQLGRLASLPFVRYIERTPPAPERLPLSQPISGDDERANILQAGLPGGYQLSGKGVTVGIYELGGAPQDHVDFSDRLVTMAGPGDLTHTTHVTGIVGGAGNVDERYTGFAPKVKILSNSSSLPRTPPVDMVLTNNSYPSGSDCDSVGLGIAGIILDQQALDYPSLQHVFAAGNSAKDKCKAYPTGYHTIYSGDQSAKSTISVGMLEATGAWVYTSSSGPTTDGRIKPDIAVTGYQVTSTWPDNTYNVMTGTSMASPAVVGGLTLLYEEYKKLRGGTNPTNALMKAVVCNSATDLGNTGPDFKYGFGRMNLQRAVALLDSGRYINGSSTQAIAHTHTITIPAHTAQLKVMLYWQDPPCSPLAASSLVNDLDLRVMGPDGVITLPYTLDTVPADVALPATRGEDHINNIEQVVIDHPAAGQYTVQIDGYAIHQGSDQPYVVTYDPVPEGVLLSSPFAGSKLVPGETTMIQWDSWGNINSPVELLWSNDSGITWHPIITIADPTQRYFYWTVPSTVTTAAVVKIIRVTDGATSMSTAFTIVGEPSVSPDADQCPGSIAISWPAVPGATGYELMILRNGSMQVFDTTTATSYRFRNLSTDSTYWVTARSRLNNQTGRRGIAVSRRPSDGTCIAAAYNGDLGVDSLVGPLTGRLFTTGAPGAHETVRVRLRNFSGQDVSAYTVKYQLNAGPWVSEAATVPAPANQPFVFSFSATCDLLAPGSYVFTIVVSSPGDVNTVNDTLHTVVRCLDNPLLQPGNNFLDDLPNAPDSTFYRSLTGIPGADRFDYSSNDGWLHTDPTHPVGSGGKGALLGSPNYQQKVHYNYLIATYNLTKFDTGVNNLGLSFSYNKQALYSGSVGDWVSVRGNDTASWIDAIDLGPLNPNTQGRIALTDLSARLRAAGQDFSSSFQVRWSQAVSFASYYIDSISLFDANKDAELLHIDSLPVNSANLGKTTPIYLTVRNNGAGLLTELPVYYRIDGLSPVTETVSSIAAGDSISYVFKMVADLSAPGPHHIEAGVALPGDLFPGNDVKRIDLHNLPVVRQYPYLENFESGDGAWYSDGLYNSWAYGHPASTLIHDAASGTKAWKTNLSGNVNVYESSYLYSPFFDLSGLRTPMISISLALNMDSCPNPAACQFLECFYRADSSALWTMLPVNRNYHWDRYITSMNYTRWHVVTDALPAGTRPIQLRWLFRNSGLHPLEGVAIDDVHVYDGTYPVYETSPAGGAGGGSGRMNPAVQQTIGGGQDWIDLVADSQVIASIQPNGQDLGLTEVQAFLHEGAVRNFHGQYYLDRNWTIRSGKGKLARPVGVRLYFTDPESDAMVFAGNCPLCTQPPHAYRLGVSQYATDSSMEDNDSISDDLRGTWSFLDSAKILVVPYGRGYYVEFITDGLGEYRLNSGGSDRESWLPVRIAPFTARKVKPTEVDLQWTTASEINIDHFAVQRAVGNQAWQNNLFDSIGSIPSKGPSRTSHDYIFKDRDSSHGGVLHYRLRAVDGYGNASFSPVISVVMTDGQQWQVYPNPSKGLFTIQYRLDNGVKAAADLYNAVGVLLSRRIFTGSGFVQTSDLDLSSGAYPAGVYFLRIPAPVNKVLKLIKLWK